MIAIDSFGLAYLWSQPPIFVDFPFTPLLTSTAAAEDSSHEFVSIHVFAPSLRLIHFYPAVFLKNSWINLASCLCVPLGLVGRGLGWCEAFKPVYIPVLQIYSTLPLVSTAVCLASSYEYLPPPPNFLTLPANTAYIRIAIVCLKITCLYEEDPRSIFPP